MGAFFFVELPTAQLNDAGRDANVISTRSRVGLATLLESLAGKEAIAAVR